MKALFISLGILLPALSLPAQDLSAPQVEESTVFEEVDGMVAIEAEHFYRQSKTDKRKWYRTSRDEKPSAGRDEDPPHVAGASGGAYLEVLPDTRVTHDDQLITGENFSNEAGVMALLHYRIRFQNPGRYYVWVRAHSTGSEDNGIHVGLNGQWPESGQRLQWCEGKNSWRWESKQRTEAVHCGEPYLIYLDIPEAGVHEISFSLREDGFEFDKFVLTMEKDPGLGEGPGPEELVLDKGLPLSFN